MTTLDRLPPETVTHSMAHLTPEPAITTIQVLDLISEACNDKAASQENFKNYHVENVGILADSYYTDVPPEPTAEELEYCASYQHKSNVSATNTMKRTLYQLLAQMKGMTEDGHTQD